VLVDSSANGDLLADFCACGASQGKFGGISLDTEDTRKKSISSPQISMVKSRVFKVAYRAPAAEEPMLTISTSFLASLATLACRNR
jgi:hypothetical protein